MDARLHHGWPDLCRKAWTTLSSIPLFSPLFLARVAGLGEGWRGCSIGGGGGGGVEGGGVGGVYPIADNGL